LQEDAIQGNKVAMKAESPQPAVPPAPGHSRPADPPLAPWLQDQLLRDRKVDLLSLMPLVAIIALVALVGAVAWTVARSDARQARNKTITDALWVEQSLRFQLGVNEDLLRRLTLDSAAGMGLGIQAATARSHLISNPEAVSVAWHDEQGNVIRALPTRDAHVDRDLARDVAMRADHLSWPVSRPIYGPVRLHDDGDDPTVGLVMRLPDHRGYVSVTISLVRLLERHLPWWVAELYGVQLLDAGDRVLAQRKRRDPPQNAASYTLSFDPPLRGSLLRITAYQQPDSLRSVALFGAIGALAVFAVLALVVLYRSAQRRRAVELRLRGETAFRRSMEESLTVGLRAKDHQGRILFVNPAFCKMIGWDADELIGLEAPMPYWNPDNLHEVQARHHRLAEGGAISQAFETQFRHRDGRIIDVKVYEAPLIDARGIHRGWMGSVIDMTETKRAERLARLQDETMARTGRLVTLGEMASTLAHELNQPLSAIASYAAGMMNLMDRGNADPGMMRMATGKLAQQAQRAGHIIHRIHDLVKKREPRFTLVRLDEVIEETLTFLAADAREHRVQLHADMIAAPRALADRILMEQVLINLIRNGMEAMSEQRHGDRITIRLTCHDDQAVIEVIDQGIGIAPEFEGRLFDAFVSTKTQGMGMGLKICRTIIELHRGHLSCRPAPGGGTIFRLTLPLAAEDTTTEEPAA